MSISRSNYLWLFLLALLTLLCAISAYGEDFGGLDPTRPDDDEDVSTHAEFLRDIQSILQTTMAINHSDEGFNLVTVGTHAEMNAATERDGRLFFTTDAPVALYVYRTACDCWTASASMTPSGDIYMYKAVYDTDADGYADSAENVYDGTNLSSAADVRTHLDDTTTNPHNIAGDDPNFTLTTPAALKAMTGYVLDDLVRIPVAGDYGAYLIPVNGTDTVGDFVDAATSDKGLGLLPWPNNADTLSAASGKFGADIVDGGYDITLLLDDTIFKAGPWIDARADGYDVTPGDSSDDDATGIELAAAAASAAGGGIVYLSPGVFDIKSSINIDESNVVIMGAGVGATTIKRHVDCGTNRTILFGDNSADVSGCGLMNLTVDTEVAGAPVKYGVKVGLSGYATSMFIHNVQITNFDGIGLEVVSARDCLFSNVFIEDCAAAELIDYAVGADDENVALTHLNCTYQDSTAAGTQIESGTAISFIGCQWHDNDAKAVNINLNASATTRAVSFDNCYFRSNQTGASGIAYQMTAASPSADRPYTYLTLTGCHFEDAVGADNRVMHLHIEDDIVLDVQSCFFNDPGPEDAILKSVGYLEDDCLLITDDYHRESWALGDNVRVRAPNAQGYAKTETMVTNIASGTPTSQAIAGLVGDRIYTTGSLLYSKMGGEIGWVCTQAGTFEAIDLGANCSMTSGNDYFTVDTSYLDNLKIGDVLEFTSVTTWDTAPFPVVRAISVNGTTATVSVDQNCGSTHVNTTAVAPDPVWSPMAMIPIHEDITVTVGAITDDDIANGSETVTGAALGDYVEVGIDWTGVTVDPLDFLIDVKVDGSDSVGWTVLNKSGSNVTTELDGFTWNFTVWKIGTTYN